MSDSAPIVALTGGTGFIGRRFADHARSNGYRIRHLTRHPDACHPADETRSLDLGEGSIDAELLKGCAIVMHLAAYIPRDHADPAEAARCWQINALGTLHLAEAATRANVRHFIHTTSANAYAAWEDHPDETAAMFPRSRGYYLGSKLLQEIYAGEVCRREGLPLATLRLGSVYGPGQTTGAVTTLAAQAAAGHRIALADGGRFGADFVHVDDVVAALMLVMAHEREGPFNVGSGVRTTMADVTQLLVAATHRDAALIDREPESPRGDMGFPPLSIDRLRSFGYAPRGVAEGLRSVIAE